MHVSQLGKAVFRIHAKGYDERGERVSFGFVK
jgi:hypothetical protein